MKKTLYLMRHGQTLFNVQQKIQGWCDSPLTSIGIKQAEVARLYFNGNNIVFDKAYCSTSERASDTLEIVTDNKMEYTRVKGLKEFSFGAYEGKDELLRPKYPFDDFFVYYGGENQEDMMNRVSKTLHEIMKKENHDVVLAVSHAGSCRSFLTYNKDNNKVGLDGVINNCCIFKYEYENDIFSCVEIINHDFSNIE